MTWTHQPLHSPGCAYGLSGLLGGMVDDIGVNAVNVLQGFEAA